MKIGKTMLMELKNSWRGFVLFLLVVIILVGGFVYAYPSFREAFENDLEGSEKVGMEVLEGEEKR